jgi:hypothetical protein
MAKPWILFSPELGNIFDPNALQMVPPFAAIALNQWAAIIGAVAYTNHPFVIPGLLSSL